MIPEIPQPSSRTLEDEERMLCLKRRFGDVIHDAKRGVIFHTTAES